MPEKKTLNEDLFYKGSSANLPRLHTCKNKVRFWDFKEFAVTVCINSYIYKYIYIYMCVCVCVYLIKYYKHPLSTYLVLILSNRCIVTFISGWNWLTNFPYLISSQVLFCPTRTIIRCHGVFFSLSSLIS